MSEPQASIGMIAQGEDYALSGTADQASVFLRSKAEFRTAHLQGDDAARLHADYQALLRQHPHWNPDQTLAQLWDQGGYSWLASQDGE